ncbi:MAG: DUF1552 domain-containing protein [Myxococcota bacterium]
MKKTLKLHRRAVLKGLGGVSIGLPLLEVMLDSQKAFGQSATPPKRYMVFFDGQSLGADRDTRHNDLVPNTIGRDYDLKSATAPLANHNNIKNEVSIVSGLSIPVANGGPVPAAGRRDDFHVSSLSPLLSGVRSPSNTASAGVTSDQVVAGFLAGNTPHRSLVYRVQADWYLSVSAPYGRDMISYRANTSGGNPVAIPPQTSPQQAFNALFGGFTPPGVDPAAAARFDFDQRSRRSILDLVRGNTERLIPKLGAADRVRLSLHLEEIRELERRVAAIPPPQTSTCVVPPSPTDPALGGNQGVDGSGNTTYGQNLGYSGEEERARAFADLIHMAFACDLSRVASLQMTMFQSHLNMYQLTGQATDCHELGHGGAPGGTLAISRGIAWHMKHFAYLVSRFRDTPEGNGSMLDNMAIVYLFEGGHGFDSGAGAQNSSHSTENMACLVAGRAGGLQPGQHVVANGMHPAQVLVTAMKAVGYTANTLGEVTGDIPALRA